MTVTEEERRHLRVLSAAARAEQEERDKLADRAFPGRSNRARRAVPHGKLTQLLNAAKAAKGLDDDSPE